VCVCVCDMYVCVCHMYVRVCHMYVRVCACACVCKCARVHGRKRLRHAHAGEISASSNLVSLHEHSFSRASMQSFFTSFTPWLMLSSFPITSRSCNLLYSCSPWFMYVWSSTLQMLARCVPTNILRVWEVNFWLNIAHAWSSLMQHALLPLLPTCLHFVGTCHVVTRLHGFGHPSHSVHSNTGKVPPGAKKWPLRSCFTAFLPHTNACKWAFSWPIMCSICTMMLS